MSARVLYIASSGIREPLIVSQVIRYLRGLRGSIGTCQLLTLERSSCSDEECKQVNTELSASGIHWTPIPSYPGNRAVNLWREIAAGYQLAVDLIQKHNLNLIHARSFIPGNIALRASRKTGAKCIYDMRGFWAEELSLIHI